MQHMQLCDIQFHPFLDFLSSYNLTLMTTTLISLLSNRKLDTFTLGQADQRLAALTNNKNVAETSDKGVVKRILDVNNIETTLVTLTVGDNTHTTQVSTTSHHNHVASVELHKRGNLSGSKIDLNRVIHLDLRIRVANSTTIMCNKVGNSFLSELDSLNFAQLVLSLLIGDAVNGKSTLDIVDKTEVLTSLLKRNDIHETSRESVVGSNFSIDLNKSLHKNGLNLTAIESILQSVSNEDDQRKRLSELVRTSRRSRGIGTGQFVQHPVGGSGETLQVLLGTSSHFSGCRTSKVLHKNEIVENRR
jgi:hypothetical protein